MPSGTYLNNVFAARIHKRNAANTTEEETANIQAIKNQLIGLVCASPTIEDVETLPFRVDEMIDSLCDSGVKRFMADYIVDFPDDCHDELEDN